MSNLETLREANEALATGSETFFRAMADDIVVIDHDLPDAGTYEGHAGVTKWLSDWNDAWESFSAEQYEFVESGDAIVSMFTIIARGRGSGVEIRRRSATVNVFNADGLIKRIDYYSTVEEALEAAGLPKEAVTK